MAPQDWALTAKQISGGVNMASSALNQLIASQRGPDIAGSVMGGIQAAKQEQAQAQQQQLQQQQITMGQKQLANMDQQQAQQKKAESLKFAADIGYQIKKEADPAKRAALYQQGRQAAQFMGADTSWWPQQYDDQTQVGLDNAIAHVYGGEMVKADLTREGKALPNDVQEAQYMGIDLRTPEGRKQWQEFKKGQARPSGEGTPYKVPRSVMINGVPTEAVVDARTGEYTLPQINGSTVGTAQYDPSNKGAMAVAEASGTGTGKAYTAIQDAGVDAVKKQNTLGRLTSLLDGIQTGKLTSTGTELAAWGKAFGLPIGEDVGNAQALKAVANGLALELRNPSGGAGMPGAMSDADRNYLQGMVAGLDKDPQANQKILDGMKKLAQRDAEVAKMARDYKKQNGGKFDEYFYDSLAKYADEHPLFTKGGAAPTKPMQNQPTQNAQGWVLHTDAKGNKAYVSPDGSQYEEVK